MIDFRLKSIARLHPLFSRLNCSLQLVVHRGQVFLMISRKPTLWSCGRKSQLFYCASYTDQDHMRISHQAPNPFGSALFASRQVCVTHPHPVELTFNRGRENHSSFVELTVINASQGSLSDLAGHWLALAASRVVT